MSLTTFLYELWSTVAGTVGYLLAYRGALVLAILAAALTRWLAAMPGASRMRGTLAGAIFAGLMTPSAKADLTSTVRFMQRRPGTSLPLLIATHVLTPYHVILLGPLLADVSTLMLPAAVLYSPTTNSAFGIELPYVERRLSTVAGSEVTRGAGETSCYSAGTSSSAVPLLGAGTRRPCSSASDRFQSPTP